MTYPARDMLTKPADGHFVMIPLTKGKFALVDEGDAELVLAAGPWNASASSDLTWYATRSDRRWPQEVASMHVLVADHKGVDHVNGNGLTTGASTYGRRRGRRTRRTVGWRETTRQATRASTGAGRRPSGLQRSTSMAALSISAALTIRPRRPAHITGLPPRRSGSTHG